jgi:hypothetical protein
MRHLAERTGFSTMLSIKYRLVSDYFCGYMWSDGVEKRGSTGFVIKDIDKKQGIGVVPP